jgi:nicotinate-nucleotide pyrophosphorylase (carboxylating)
MNRPPYVTREALKEFIAYALREDIGEGDHTSMASIPWEAQHSARLLVKDHGVLAGIELAKEIFLYYEPSLRVEIHLHDGDRIEPGQAALTVSGSARALLTTERLVLNCVQRMSGIATYTNRLNALLHGTAARLKDTRKTTPNFRLAEKWAVAIGGGLNHRFGLDDMIMLKDNHIDMAGGIRAALEQTLDYMSDLPEPLPVEIETRNLAEVEEVLQVGGVQTIMLDNFALEDLRRAVRLINGRYQTEASGGITEHTLRAVAETGVDFISVGALTHSVRSLDLSLKAVKAVR